MINNYTGIKAICHMLKTRGLITEAEFENCLKELNASWEEEAARVINETLEKVLDK